MKCFQIHLRAVLFVLVLGPSSLFAKVYMNQEEALALAFSSGAVVERRDVFLTDEQLAAMEEKGKSKIQSKLWTYYQSKNADGLIGYAFFETHVVKTMPETFMAVLDKNGRIRFVEILAFFEPEDYKPPKKWLNQYEGRRLEPDLWIKRGIRNITGSTLSTQAMNAGIRRVLAFYETIIRPAQNSR